MALPVRLKQNFKTNDGKHKVHQDEKSECHNSKPCLFVISFTRGLFTLNLLRKDKQ